MVWGGQGGQDLTLPPGDETGKETFSEGVRVVVTRIEGRDARETKTKLSSPKFGEWWLLPLHGAHKPGLMPKKPPQTLLFPVGHCERRSCR